MATVTATHFFTFYAFVLSTSVALVSSVSPLFPPFARRFVAALQGYAVACAFGVYVAISVASFTFEKEELHSKDVRRALVGDFIGHSLPLIVALGLLLHAREFEFEFKINAAFNFAYVSTALLNLYVLNYDYRDIYGDVGVKVNPSLCWIFYASALFGGWLATQGVLG